MNVNNLVSDCIKLRNDELKNMINGTTSLNELESEILSPDDKMITEITTSNELKSGVLNPYNKMRTEEADESVIEM